MLTPGDRVDRYVVELLIGQGGMGSVYRCHDMRLERRVALKVVSAERLSTEEGAAHAKARLLREARAAAALDHPNAVHVYDVGEIDGTAYIVMELVEGESLRSRVSDPTTPLAVRLGWLIDVARALSAAHEAGLVHRDVKPENVMIRRDGRVKVLDFGIARRSAAAVDPSAPTQPLQLSTLTTEGIQVGTPMYMAPEQLRAEPVDGRTDEFAWGVVAFEVLAGRPPWKAADGVGLVASILSQPAPDLGGLCPELEPGVSAIVARALAKDPRDRFASMDDLVRAMSPFVEPRESSASSPPPRSLGAVPRISRAVQQPIGTLEARAYSTDELRAIVQRALERRTVAGFGYDEVVDAAREVGIEEGAVRAAARELKHEGFVPPGEARALVKQKLFRHIATWAVGSVFLLVFSVIIKGEIHRSLLIGIAAWAVAIALKTVNYFFPDARQRRTTGAHRRAAVDEARVEAGVDALVTAAQVRARIAVPGPARQRFVDETDAMVSAAESEAEAQREVRKVR